MKEMTMDVLIAIIQSNLASHMGQVLSPDSVKEICSVIRDSVEHHKHNDNATPIT